MKRKTGYPIATAASYGPDNQFASKVVVGVRASETDEYPRKLHKWFSKDMDVRLNTEMRSKIVEFIKINHVRQVAKVDIIGECPHEEGIDDPSGEVCLQYPYRANRDRRSGERVS